MPKKTIPQLNWPVLLLLVLPPTTPEWADELLEQTDLFDEVKRDDNGNLIVKQTVHGNCNALVNSRLFIDDVEEALQEGNIDPLSFMLTTIPVAPEPDPRKKSRV